MSKENTCCVTGHRDIPSDRARSVKEQLRQEMRRAIYDGYTHFISGFASGAELFFAEIVANELLLWQLNNSTIC